MEASSAIVLLGQLNKYIEEIYLVELAAAHNAISCRFYTPVWLKVFYQVLYLESPFSLEKKTENNPARNRPPSIASELLINPLLNI